MKSLEALIEMVKSGKIHPSSIDRYKTFLTDCQLTELGFPVKAPVAGEPERDWFEFTHENVVAELKKLVAEGFDYAFAHRGVSAARVYQTLCIYSWLLEDGIDRKLANDTLYGVYGLPLLKVTAVKYGFNNPIGEDEGNEDRYFLQPQDFEITVLPVIKKSTPKPDDKDDEAEDDERDIRQGTDAEV